MYTLIACRPCGHHFTISGRLCQAVVTFLPCCFLAPTCTLNDNIATRKRYAACPFTKACTTRRCFIHVLCCGFVVISRWPVVCDAFAWWTRRARGCCRGATFSSLKHCSTSERSGKIQRYKDLNARASWPLVRSPHNQTIALLGAHFRLSPVLLSFLYAC